MCISNARAFAFIVWTKHVYHKYSLGHVLLLLSYFCFILVSASAFFVIESYTSRTFRARWLRKLAYERNRFITNDLLPEIFNNTRLLLYIHDKKSQHVMDVVNAKLELYENHLKLRPPMPSLPCTFANSLLFVFSTITTIGYGYIYPVTHAGRILSIVISAFGIPFTIVVVKDVAYLLAKLLNYPCVLLRYLWEVFRFCTLEPVDEYELERGIRGRRLGPRRDFRLSLMDRLLDTPVMVAVLALFGWTWLGVVLVSFQLPHLSSSVAFYFIFNSLTTIGVGDVDPGESPLVLLLLFLYILVGLSIVSLFINLLHTKFSRVYWLPNRLYLPLGHPVHPTSKSRPISAGPVASFDSCDEDFQLSDCPLNHYVTLGVLQTDDKCPLLGLTAREQAYMDADTQTATSPLPVRPRSRDPPETVALHMPRTSHDDVNALIVETYGSRPPRLISSRT